MVENVRELLKAHEGLKREVYLDIENGGIVSQEVLEAMLPYFNQRAYGNPTLTHKPGWEAFEAIMESAQKIARFLGCKNPEDVNFTPGETEANNLALLGTTFQKRDKGKKIVISEIEPLSVIHVAEMLTKYGFSVAKIPVDGEGFINLEKLDQAIDKETVLVSLSAVNHEIGTIQPLKEAVEIVKSRNPDAVFHTDASDAYGKIPFNVQTLNVDLATISGSKILGPRGTAALYTREGVNVERILEGQIGTQRLWPGVENTPLIVGFAKASELAFQNFEENVSRMRKLRDKLMNGIFEKVPDVRLNGPKGQKRAPDNINISFLRCEGEALTIELSLNGVYVSSGSACTRRVLQPSHVLVAIGRKFEEAHGSILMKVTRQHKDDDIDYALEAIPKAVERIRRITGSTGVE
ncbi:MAG: cysteine desulfurase family protein [Nitrososphaerota archaeon]|nr:cysteine desulfurase [Candidatus Bathyarchaeota archaeon]MDW8023340.1 cysteine desulfurase family protein [Nitrososphaerota archaeon]